MRVSGSGHEFVALWKGVRTFECPRRELRSAWSAAGSRASVGWAHRRRSRQRLRDRHPRGGAVGPDGADRCRDRNRANRSHGLRDRQPQRQRRLIVPRRRRADDMLRRQDPLRPSRRRRNSHHFSVRRSLGFARVHGVSLPPRRNGRHRYRWWRRPHAHEQRRRSKAARHDVQLPNLRHMTIGTARHALHPAHCRLGRVHRRHHTPRHHRSAVTKQSVRPQQPIPRNLPSTSQSPENGSPERSRAAVRGRHASPHAGEPAARRRAPAGTQSASVGPARKSDMAHDLRAVGARASLAVTACRIATEHPCVP
jgi:hypothetical protein